MASLEQLLAIQGLGAGNGGGSLDTTALLSGLGGNQTSNAGLDLSSFGKTIAANDPFSIASGAIDAWKPNTSTWSPTESGIASFAKAFIGGALGGIGRNNQADQLNSVIGILPQLYKDPASVATPDGVDQGAFDTLKGASILKKFQTDSVSEEKQKEGVRSLLEKLDISPKEKLAIATSNDPASAIANLSGGTSDRLTAQMDALGVPQADRAAIGNLDDLKFYASAKLAKDQSKDLAQQRIDQRNDKTNLTQEGELRRELLKAGTPYFRATQLAPLLPAAQANMALGTSAGDIGLLDVLNKAINPGGVLQEGLLKITKDAQSPFQKFLGEIQNVQGNGQFSPQTRKDFFNVLSNYINEGMTAGKASVDNQYKIAKDSGLTPEHILSLDEYNRLFTNLTDSSGSSTTISPTKAQLVAEADALRASNPSATPQQIADALRQKYQGQF